MNFIYAYFFRKTIYTIWALYKFQSKGVNRGLFNDTETVI
jgi:hypothetical protein